MHFWLFCLCLVLFILVFIHTLLCNSHVLRYKIHRSAQLFTLRFVGLCLSVNYIFLFLLLLILLYTLFIYFLLDLFVVYSFVFYLFSLGGAWRCKKRLAFVLLGLPIFFRISGLLPSPKLTVRWLEKSTILMVFTRKEIGIFHGCNGEMAMFRGLLPQYDNNFMSKTHQWSHEKTSFSNIW